MRNVHKIDGQKIKLPTELQEEDRGYKACGTPFLALADLTDTVQWKNDVFGVAMIADSITVELEDHSGNLVNAIGYSVTFPFQDDATGFVIDWRSNLIAYGAGCYRVKVSFDINGFTGDFYRGTFELMPYSITASEKTVRLLANYNDLVKQDGINYRDSGFYTSIRVHGYFGDEQVNSEHNNILKSNDVREKVRNFSAPIYTFRTRPVNRCFTRPIKHILLNASNFWVSDYNAWSHESYKDFNIILNEESSIEMEGEETPVRSIIAEFKDKNWSTESKFSGNNAEPPNLSELISEFASVCADVNVVFEGANIGSVVSGNTLTITLKDTFGNELQNSYTLANDDLGIVVDIEYLFEAIADLFESKIIADGGDFEAKQCLINTIKNEFV